MENNNCSSCGSKIEFSPHDKALKCINCGNLYNIEYSNNVKKHAIGWLPDKSKLDEWSGQNRSYKCNVCGAQVTFNKFDIVAQCSYCCNSSLSPLKDLPGLKPEKIIPFKIDKSQAREAFVIQTTKRKFLPNHFKKNLPTAQMGATYISSFSFDGFVSATYSGRQSHTRTIREKDGRTRTETYYTYFSGQIDKQYADVVVEASDKILQEDIVDILPYDFSECVDYNNDFIKGYNVGYYNQDVQQAEIVGKKEMLKDIECQIRKKYSSIDSLTINPTYSNIEYNYTLLPTYFINFNYKNKQYFNIMNGQNGKLTGKVPRSGLKILLFVLFILGIIALPILMVVLSM